MTERTLKRCVKIRDRPKVKAETEQPVAVKTRDPDPDSRGNRTKSRPQRPRWKPGIGSDKRTTLGTLV